MACYSNRAGPATANGSIYVSKLPPHANKRGEGQGDVPAKSRQHDGGWLCPNTRCANLNFAFRVVCNRCGIARPPGAGGTWAADAGRHRIHGSTGAGGRGREVGGASGLFRPNDWPCLTPKNKGMGSRYEHCGEMQRISSSAFNLYGFGKRGGPASGEELVSLKTVTEVGHGEKVPKKILKEGKGYKQSNDGEVLTMKKQEGRHGSCTIIPNDLIFDILAHIPAKSIGRLRCVSKQWLSLTTTPQFIHTHASLAPISGFIPRPNFCRYHIPLDGLSHLDRLPDPFFPYRDKSIGGGHFCNHGLLLHHGILENKHTFYQSIEKEKHTPAFYICNPMTKKLRIIPRPMPGWVFGNAFVMDTLKPTQFKVAVWEWDSERFPQKCKLHVYSSMTRSWRSLYETDSERTKEWQFCQPVSWNGSIAWRSERGSFLLLDVKEEKVKEVAQPNLPCHHLGESRGRLHFIGDVAGYVDRLDIIEMESETTGWSVLYHHLDLSCVRDSYPDMDGPPKCIGFVRGDSIKEDQLLLTLSIKLSYSDFGSMVISFLPRSKLCSTIIGIRPTTTLWDLAPHVHSLLSLY